MTAPAPEGSSEWLDQAAALLEAWFSKNARPLPWRKDRSPYAVLVSETMLQQTRIETVLGYFERFMKRFPDVAALASAPQDEVLKLWEGLGYYSRARNLQKAAQVCMQEYGGSIPQTASELKKLPGVGDYTAGAVASIAFGEAVPAVDGNVLRILVRLLADERSIMDKSVRREAAERLTAVLRTRPHPGRFNEALMELGELICLPGGRPLCRRCPISDYCRALAAGTEQDLPNRGEMKPRRKEEKTVLILCCKGKVALEKRPPKGLLAGLYGFPMLDGYWDEGELRSWLMSYGVPLSGTERLADAIHVFTHVEWHMRGWRIHSREALPDYIYADSNELESRYALPSAFRAYKNDCFPVGE